MDNLKKNTFRASRWALSSRVFIQGISFIFGIYIARLLTPDDYGLVAMVLVFIGFAETLTNFGFGSALIQGKDINENHYNSVFILNLIVGITLMMVMIYLADYVAKFYGRSELVHIVISLSLMLLIGILMQVPMAILSRSLDFKSIATADLISLFAGISLAIYLAKNGFGYWSLIANLLVKQFLNYLLLMRFSSWSPRLKFQRSCIESLLSFSGYLFGTKILQYVAGNVDKLIMGKYLGGDAVGLYDRSLSMMFFPLRNISQVVAKVIFPSLSSIQDDKVRVKSIYLRVISAVALFTFPLVVGMFVVSDVFIKSVLGAAWMGAVPLIKIFCIAGMAMSLVSISGAVYLSQGKSKVQFKVNIFTQLLKVAAVVVGVRWGVIGVAFAYTAAIVINSMITLKVAGSLIGASLGEIITAVLPLLLASLCMGLGVWLFERIFSHENGYVLLLSQIILGVLIYLSIVFSFKLEPSGEIVKLIKG